MAKRTGAANEYLKALVTGLKKQSNTHNTALWKQVAEDLEKPTRKRRVVNLSRINRYTKENETVIVPGKVLGAGTLSHNIVVAAFAFSRSAREQIEAANGKCLTIEELAKQNPKGQYVRIIG